MYTNIFFSSSDGTENLEENEQGSSNVPINPVVLQIDSTSESRGRDSST